MEFINENLVWIIGIGVFLLMAFIGFLAERANFGKKDKPIIQKIEEENEPVVSIEPQEEVLETNEVTDDTSAVEEPFFEDLPQEEEPQEVIEPFFEDLPQEEVVVENNEELPILEELPIEEETEELPTLEELPAETEAEELPELEEMPTEEETETVEEPFFEDLNQDDVSTTDEENKEIEEKLFEDSTVEEPIAEEVDEENLWKF